MKLSPLLTVLISQNCTGSTTTLGKIESSSGKVEAKHAVNGKVNLVEKGNGLGIHGLERALGKEKHPEIAKMLFLNSELYLEDHCVIADQAFSFGYKNILEVLLSWGVWRENQRHIFAAQMYKTGWCLIDVWLKQNGLNWDMHPTAPFIADNPEIFQDLISGSPDFPGWSEEIVDFVRRNLRRLIIDHDSARIVEQLRSDEKLWTKLQVRLDSTWTPERFLGSSNDRLFKTDIPKIKLSTFSGTTFRLADYPLLLQNYNVLAYLIEKGKLNDKVMKALVKSAISYDRPYVLEALSKAGVLKSIPRDLIKKSLWERIPEVLCWVLLKIKEDPSFKIVDRRKIYNVQNSATKEAIWALIKHGDTRLLDELVERNVLCSFPKSWVDKASGKEPGIVTWAIEKAHHKRNFTLDQSFLHRPPKNSGEKVVEWYKLYKELYPDWSPEANLVKEAGWSSTTLFNWIISLGSSICPPRSNFGFYGYGAEETLKVFKRNNWEPTEVEAISAARSGNIEFLKWAFEEYDVIPNVGLVSNHYNYCSGVYEWSSSTGKINISPEVVAQLLSQHQYKALQVIHRKWPAVSIDWSKVNKEEPDGLFLLMQWNEFQPEQQDLDNLSLYGCNAGQLLEIIEKIRSELPGLVPPCMKLEKWNWSIDLLKECNECINPNQEFDHGIAKEKRDAMKQRLDHALLCNRAELWNWIYEKYEIRPDEESLKVAMSGYALDPVIWVHEVSGLLPDLGVVELPQIWRYMTGKRNPIREAHIKLAEWLDSMIRIVNLNEILESDIDVADLEYILRTKNVDKVSPETLVKLREKGRDDLLELLHDSGFAPLDTL